MNGDEVDQLTQACVLQASQPKAQVSTTTQRSAEYGEVKCSVTVTLTCPQSGAWLDYCAKIGFKTALRYCNDGFSWLRPDATRLEGPQ